MICGAVTSAASASEYPESIAADEYGVVVGLFPIPAILASSEKQSRLLSNWITAAICYWSAWMWVKPTILNLLPDFLYAPWCKTRRLYSLDGVKRLFSPVAFSHRRGPVGWAVDNHLPSELDPISPA
jgi:hypothetical protein